ncbi:hypothetical protein [Enterocloster sp.]
MYHHCRYRYKVLNAGFPTDTAGADRRLAGNELVMKDKILRQMERLFI